MLPYDLQIHSCALHWPNLGVEINITRQTLFSFSVSKTRDEVLYEMFSLRARYTLFGGSWLIDYGVNCKGHEQVQALINICFFTSTSQIRPGRDVKNPLHE